MNANKEVEHPWTMHKKERKEEGREGEGERERERGGKDKKKEEEKKWIAERRFRNEKGWLTMSISG